MLFTDESQLMINSSNRGFVCKEKNKRENDTTLFQTHRETCGGNIFMSGAVLAHLELDSCT